MNNIAENLNDIIMKRPFVVFLSSTKYDLAGEREAALEAIRRINLNHDCMEYFGARHDQPLEVCLKEVRESDILVIIIGHLYGSLVPGRDISFTEAEYQEGYRLGKPCLVYFRDENVPILPKFIESDPKKIDLLKNFKKKLQSRHTIMYFKSLVDLSAAVSVDLIRAVQAIENTKENEPDLVVETTPFAEINEIVKDAIAQGIDEHKVVSRIQNTISALLLELRIRPPRIFFSYAYADLDVAHRVANGLRKENFDVWIDQSEIRCGNNIYEKIKEGIKSADFFLYFISKNSQNSEWVQRELDIIIAYRLSIESRVKIIPIMLDSVDIPSIIRDVKFIDAREGSGINVIKELSEMINNFLETRNIT